MAARAPVANSTLQFTTKYAHIELAVCVLQPQSCSGWTVSPRFFRGNPLVTTMPMLNFDNREMSQQTNSPARTWEPRAVLQNPLKLPMNDGNEIAEFESIVFTS